MSANTKIEWATHTFNGWEGCQKVGPGCDHCYAENRNARFGGGVAVNWGPSAPRRRTSEQNWNLPLKWNEEAKRLHERHRVFCSSLADVFDKAVPSEWRQDLAKLILATPNLDWLLLTKRVGNAAAMLAEMFPDGIPSNVWVGATIVNQEEADRDIPKLLSVPAARRFLSMEPLLGPVELNGHEYSVAPGLGEGIDWLTGRTNQHSDIFGGDTTPWRSRDIYDFPQDAMEPRIHWVIVGGESGPKARPLHPQWVRSLRDQCQSAGIPFFFKQWGEWSPRAKICGAGEDFQSIDPQCKRWPHVIRLGEHGLDTRIVENCTPKAGEEVFVQRVGKATAGRMLDGRLWDEVPREVETSNE